MSSYFSARGVSIENIILYNEMKADCALSEFNCRRGRVSAESRFTHESKHFLSFSHCQRSIPKIAPLSGSMLFMHACFISAMYNFLSAMFKRNFEWPVINKTRKKKQARILKLHHNYCVHTIKKDMFTSGYFQLFRRFR